MVQLEGLKQTPAFQQLKHLLQQGYSLANLRLTRAPRLAVLAALWQELQRPVVFLVDRMPRAISGMEELGLYLPQAERMLFSEPNALFYEPLPWGLGTRQSRIAVLKKLAFDSLLNGGGRQETPPPIIFTSIRALMTKTMPRRDFVRSTLVLKRRKRIQLNDLLHQLVSLGYQAVNTVVEIGQFAHRGGLVDVWSLAEPFPVRLDFFDDEVDTLRWFDASTQRTLEAAHQVIISPAREFIWDSHHNPPWSGERPLCEMDIPKLYPQGACLLNYLPANALLIVDDENAIWDTMDELERQALTMREDAIQNLLISKDDPLPFLPREEVQPLLAKTQHLVLGASYNANADVENEVDDIGERVGVAIGGLFEQHERYGGRIKPLLEKLASDLTRETNVIIVTRQTNRLQELWEEQRLLYPELERKSPQFIQGSLAEGWVFKPPAELGLPATILLSDGEIFGWQPPQPRRRARPAVEDPEAAYADLHLDDYVVHVDYGVGVYRGLVRRTLEGIENEYLCIEYAQGDQLFVPVYQADRVMRYVGVDGRQPSLHRLGSADWQSVKHRVKESVEQVAEELLQLYALRQVIKGHAFKKDTPWQQELEASFPYTETSDQLQALAEVKRDMENERPMDRLICGDVGYGKTEIALRAAFKAVMDGKQVAMLVPTTVLAQQHYQTFCERLAPFPVTIEMLSRFRTPQEQQVILERLEQGGIDIIIGTHRLLSGDVEFKDLGLLIIDEEQRFGVTHKEKLKKMRQGLDVLTLTATPIPRTLYMALTELRDISIINTPPAERLPVITHVGPYSPRLVRQAILREIERGGQTFFVHNRVQTIEAMYKHLQKLVPEAKIVVAHGQMAEHLLSQRMQAFANPEEEDEKVDVLLSTSIIESGLDIPNANTLIVDRADTFGLAQLYQLRGRIGRGSQRAYAYFFRHRKITPTLEAKQRLETLAEYTHLGAGYAIAMRDLEIRGAGEILGTQQHGQIAAVGFHLYTRLLAEAVRRLKKQYGIKDKISAVSHTSVKGTASLPLPVAVDLPLSISIPTDYVTDKTVRLGLYRRLAELRELSEVDNLEEEFADRFGPLPQEVINLFYQLRIKLMTEQAGLVSISTEGNLLALRFPPLPRELLQRDFPSFDKEVRVGKNTLWIEWQKREDWQSLLMNVLKKLIQHADKRETLAERNHAVLETTS